jgi:hypothetical protein
MEIPMPKNRTLFLLPCLVLCLLGVLSSSVLADPSGLLLPDNFSYAARIVLPLHEKAVLGSGFYYRTEESIYFVTARHVLFAPTQVAIKDGATFPIPRQLLHRIRYDKAGRLLSLEGVLSSEKKDAMLTHPSTNESGRHAVEYLYEKSQRLKLKAHTATVVTCAPGTGELELGLTRMLIKGLVKYHPVQDVAVIKLGSSTTCGAPNCIDFVPEVQVRKPENLTALDATDVKLMQEPSPERKQPLLRKGTVAAMNKQLGIIALNCATYPGDSGGLVLEVGEGSDEKHLKGIGVMSGVFHYEKDKQDSKNYSFATALDAVIELLNQ